MNQPKILFLDIEISPMQVYTYDLKPKYINPDMIISSNQILSWSWCWDHDRECKFMGVFENTEKQIVRAMHKAIEEADSVVTWNGTSFDLKFIQHLFIKHGLPRNSHYVSTDLMRICKSMFRYPSYRLNYVAEQLLGKQKVDTGGFSMWKEVMECKDQERLEKVWAKVEEYNIMDVLLMVDIYHLKSFRSYVKSHPNWGHFVDHGIVCKNCGSRDIAKNGWQVNLKKKYQRFRCKKCGSPLRGESIKEDRNILT